MLILDTLVVAFISSALLVALAGVLSLFINGIWLIKDLRSEGWKSVLSRRTWRTGLK